MPSRLFQDIRLLVLAGVTLGVVGISGCGGGGGDSPSPDASTNASATGPGIINGKVVSAMTHQGVAGASVKLFVNKVPQTVTTVEDDSTTADTNEVGDFEFRNVPAGQHRLRIESSSHASYEGWVTVQPSTTPNYVAAGSNGRIELQLGCATDVFVTFAGAPILGATVYASAANAPEIVGTTDATGKASLAGLAQNINYLIVSPALDRAADGSSDGTYDYLTATQQHQCSSSDKTLALSMTRAGRNDGIVAIGSTANKYRNFTTGGAISPSEDIQIVYNYPVALDTADVILRYDGWLFADGVAGVGVDLATTATLSAGGTVLTIHPKQTPPVHAMLNIIGSVSATIFGDPSIASIYGSGLYVFDPAPLGDGSALYADNYNGQTAKAGQAGNVAIKFPEKVNGSVTVLSYTQNGKTTVPAAALVTALDSNWNGSGVFRDKTWGGCAAGICGSDTIYYKVPLSGIPALEDNQSGVANSVTVVIDASDAEGHRLIKTVTLPIE